MDLNTVTDKKNVQSKPVTVNKKSKPAAKAEAKPVNLPELQVAVEAAKAAGITKDGFEPKTEQDKDKLKDAIAIANNSLRQQRTQLQFSYHEKLNKVSIKVIDSTTLEVLKEIPPEKTLKALERLYEIPGLMMDKKI